MAAMKRAKDGKEENRQPVKLVASLKTYVNLNLSMEKRELMKESMFYNFVNIKNGKESSAPLIKNFCDMYEPVNKKFVFNDEVSFSFCAEEVAKAIGIKNTGVDYSAPAATEFPNFLPNPMKAAQFKKILSEFDINEVESQNDFRKLLSFFLLEQFFMCSPDPKKPRKSSWGMVEDLDAFENVNWAKAIYDNIHLSFGKLKEAMNKQFKQVYFQGCAPVFEAIVFDRIESLRPKEYDSPSPPIQRFKAKRMNLEDKSVLATLKSSEIKPCEWCGSVDVAEDEDDPRVNCEQILDETPSSPDVVPDRCPEMPRSEEEEEGQILLPMGLQGLSLDEDAEGGVNAEEEDVADLEEEDVADPEEEDVPATPPQPRKSSRTRKEKVIYSPFQYLISKKKKS